MPAASRFRTYLALGPANLARVAIYRAGLKLGAHPVLRLRGEAPAGPFFAHPADGPGLAQPIARQTWRDEMLYFGYHRFACDGPPDWHANPFRPGVRADPAVHWSAIPDFDPAVGDIKTVWEASRFDWLIAMAQRAALGDGGELERLNAWLADWVGNNPPYLGANWKCGQEASIRVMHLALAALLLGQVATPQPSLRRLVRTHLARIAPTMSYAIGQQNNHGTSEAAALFVGGSWLASLGDGDGHRWAATGRKWLEQRARALIVPDGTFSQYSVVYHRMMLDTYAFAETWRAMLGLDGFSDGLLGRLRAATEWLRQLVDPGSGDAPNLGANDGARILALTDASYRDFRPSLQWACALFHGRRCLPAGPWDQQLCWLGLSPPDEALPGPASASLDDGGLHVLRRGAARAYLRYPRFRFRPSQCDVLHLDLWLGERNVLRDGGTFSYNGTPEDLAYFSGVASHNTVQFDGREQMPRLGRFLFGSWPRAEGVRLVTPSDDGCGAAAGYRDHRGARHFRSVELGNGRLVCRDTLGGTAKRAVIRWRLEPGDWQLQGRRVTCGGCEIAVESDGSPVELCLVEGSESRFYLQRDRLPVLEVRVPVPAVVETRVSF